MFNPADVGPAPRVYSPAFLRRVQIQGSLVHSLRLSVRRWRFVAIVSLTALAALAGAVAIDALGGAY